jgi:hypothetical protein
VNLRSGEADALILAHRLEHVVDELLDARRRNFSGIDRSGAGAQDGVAHARDLQDRHDRQLFHTPRPSSGVRIKLEECNTASARRVADRSSLEA